VKEGFQKTIDDLSLRVDKKEETIREVTAKNAELLEQVGKLTSERDDLLATQAKHNADVEKLQATQESHNAEVAKIATERDALREQLAKERDTTNNNFNEFNKIVAERDELREHLAKERHNTNNNNNTNKFAEKYNEARGDLEKVGKQLTETQSYLAYVMNAGRLEIEAKNAYIEFLFNEGKKIFQELETAKAAITQLEKENGRLNDLLAEADDLLAEADNQIQQQQAQQNTP
jgi:chromosome segregation ATPase